MKGVDKVLKNLMKAAREIKDKSGRGVVKGALFIRRESQKLTPIRLGNLRNSAYVVSSGLDPAAGAGGGFKDAPGMDAQHKSEKASSKQQTIRKNRGDAIPTAAVGYSAVYALSVHENPNAGATGSGEAEDVARQTRGIKLETIHSKRGQWKFLEDPLKSNEAKLLGFIKQEAQIDG